ncbi:MAG: hypothetical protein Q4E13_15435, partial [Clostridia bacterium]|nr:hypothetical protein [Clostridia bacterium]
MEFMGRQRQLSISRNRPADEKRPKMPKEPHAHGASFKKKRRERIPPPQWSLKLFEDLGHNAGTDGTATLA